MNGVREFLRDETGAVTIEFVTLVPMFVLMLMFFTDASILYLTHSDMLNAARDIARRMSTEQITTTEQAQKYAAENLQLYNRVYVLTTDPVLAEMTVTISVGVRDAAIFGAFLAPVLGRNLSATATMRRDPLI
jgi:Flp pilus assembly protein TadG